MRRALAWIAGVALIAAAALVVQLEPSEDAQQAPFAQQAQLGERVEGRTHAVTFTRVVAATRVHDQRGWSDDGTWIVVDARIEATRSESTSLLQHTELQVGDLRFRASDRPTSMRDTVHTVGVPREGSFAFELGELPLEGEATIVLGRSVDARLDSTAELRIDLAALEVEADAEIRSAEWVQ